MTDLSKYFPPYRLRAPAGSWECKKSVRIEITRRHGTQSSARMVIILPYAGPCLYMT